MADEKKLDQFWDLKELIPAKQVAKPHNISASVSTTEIEIFPLEKTQESNQTSLNIEHITKPQNEVWVSYEKLTPFIKQVTVKNWKNEYNYYDLFCRQAAVYSKMEPKECVHEHFFSYMPQYSQMSQKQLNWYIWWKSLVKKGIYQDTDNTYIMLYVFELINMSDEGSASHTLDILINLWSNYHSVYPQLNKTLGEWICDFALIYRIPIRFPDERITPEMISSVSIPEIFYTFDMTDSTLFTKFLLSYCNSYNYRKSKFYNEETARLYEKHIINAVESVIKENNLGNKIFNEAIKRTTRIAFMGALCTYKIKKHIEVSYASLALEGELKAYVSDLIKCAENQLRGVIGIRSRLSVRNIDETTQKSLEKYFSLAFKCEIEKSIRPEYEKLYDSADNSFSLEKANEIERISWNITEKLVETFGETDPYEEPPLIPMNTHDVNEEEDAILSTDDETIVFLERISKYKELFGYIKDEDFNSQTTYARAQKLILEAVVDEINELAIELLGDILLEESENGYKLIDEYKNNFS